MVGTQPVNRKKAFNMLFFLEFWERFGFYGLQAVLAGFFVKSLGMEDAESFVVFGAFSAMVYGYVSIGGFLGDKYDRSKLYDPHFSHGFREGKKD